MRTSQYLLYTLKSIPKNIETISHKLMLQAGLIRQTQSGLYTWLPNGLKILKKINNIIKYEMECAGATEICFPIMQGKDLWSKSKRLHQYGKELITIYDRNNNRFILSPTYEEMATEFVKQEITSYKKLPIILYQIQKKFRDEIRPRCGIIRAREFIMKDAYSFHNNLQSLQDTYQKIHLTYIKIFQKMQLKFYSVTADCGIIGGNYSHEFQSLSKNGEDKIIVINKKKYKTHKVKLITQNYITKNFFYKKKIYIKNPYHANQINKKNIKIYIIKFHNRKQKQFIGCIIREDHILNIKKIITEKIIYIKNPKIVFPYALELENIIKKIQTKNIYISMIIDPHVLYLKKIIAKFTINDTHYNINFIDQNFQSIQINNIIQKKEKDEVYKIKNCIEIGHIFQIGKKYSKIMDLQILDQNKSKRLVYMGCYGIGVSRLIAAIIEQHHDAKGIIWPKKIAPFELLIIPINFNKCKEIRTISEKLYHAFTKEKIEVLLEDRNEHINTIFSDANLLGIPNIIIVNQNSVNNHTIEYQERKNIKYTNIIHLNKIHDFIISKIKNI